MINDGTMEYKEQNMNKNIDEQYIDLLKDILENGIKKNDRTGTGTISVFGRQLRHSFKDGKFPLLTTKRIPFKLIVTELLWFLCGDTNIKYLVDNDCHIWNGDAYKSYEKKALDVIGENEKDKLLSKEEFINKIKTDDEFAKKWGNLGSIYGKQWRRWIHYFPKTYPEVSQYEQYIGVKTIDQITNLINELKANPDSRRLMVTAWNPADLDSAVLPPCHYGFQVYTRELSVQERIEWYNERNEYKVHTDFYAESTHQKIDDSIGRHIKIPKRAISLMYNARSQDVPLGTPFNIASYALLLEIIAKMVNMVPDQLIGNLGDCHIYLNQIDGVKEQITRELYTLPKLVISDQVNFNHNIGEFLNSCLITDFQVEGYQSHPAIKIPLSN